MSPKPDNEAAPALDVMEQAFMLLRSAPLLSYVIYYLGAVPFWLAALYFVADMSRSAFAAEQLASHSLLVTLFFFGMKCTQAVFASHLTAILSNHSAEWNFKRAVRLVRTQIAIQGWSLFVRLIAGMVLVPIVWVSAFYQNVSVLGDGQAANRSMMARAWTQAKAASFQLHTIHGYAVILGFLIYLNAAIGMVLVPIAAKQLFGFETAISRDPMVLFNTTFFGACFAVTMLLVDPILKAVYTLRCFAGESKENAADLRAQLAVLTRNLPKGVLTALAALICLMAQPGMLFANDTPVNDSGEPARLNQSIDEVLAHREFAWRAPRRAAEAEKGGESWLDSVSHMIKNTLHSVAHFFGELFKYLFGRGSNPGESASGITSAQLQIMLYLFVAVGVIAIAITIWRSRRGKIQKASIIAVAEARPDIASDDVSATDLPEDGWLRFARELSQRGELRLALRALYLAGLAKLGERQFLTIARHKSNRDYDRELRRRAKSQPGVISAFSENMNVFESAWYGSHEVTPEILQRFTGNLEVIRN